MKLYDSQTLCQLCHTNKQLSLNLYALQKLLVVYMNNTQILLFCNFCRKLDDVKNNKFSPAAMTLTQKISK